MEGQVPPQLLLLPEEVFYGYIFPKVSLSDTLRVRRVCKPLKIFGDAYLRVNHVTQEREINEGDHSFAEFLRRDLPSSSIYLNNRDTSIFEQPEVPLFLEKYGDQVTQLRVNYFATCLSPAEDKFYVGLKNLQHLELMFIDTSGRNCRKSYPDDPTYIPPTFRNLKTLKLHDLKTEKPFDNGYYFDLVKFCVDLEHLKHPYYLWHDVGEFGGAPFGIVTTEIKNRLEDNPNYTSPLRVFDLEHHQEKGYSILALRPLAELAEKQGIRLWNVDGDMLGGGRWGQRDSASTRRAIANTVTSVRNLPAYIFARGEMPLLEKVKITTMRKVAYSEDLYHGRLPPQWPRLRELELNVDDDQTAADEDMRVFREEAYHFLNFLFEMVERTELTTLKIDFDRKGICDAEMEAELPYPTARGIVGNCKNLKVIHLYNWLGTNKALSQLWAGLEMLEEVTLEKCKAMGNVAFVGKDKEDPTFLKLTNLRKLSLLDLDQMPKITDTIFHLVFQHLKIKEFRITSDKPINSVTVHGIRALTQGAFQDSVTKFPFTGWSLRNVREDYWEKLKNEFRATFML